MKKEKKLILSVKTRNFRGAEEFVNDTSFAEVKKFVKERDQGACVYCGDTYEKFQEVHHIDNDHNNNDQENLETVCTLCHACHHIGLAGIQNRGIIVYMPEVSQVDINRAHKLLMCVAQKGITVFSRYSAKMEAYVALETFWGDNKGVAPLLGEIIEDRARIVEEQYCQGWSNPSVLGEVLLSRTESEYAQREAVVGDLRMIPVIGSTASKKGYMRQINYWTKAFQKELPVRSWPTLIKSNADKITLT